MKMKVFLTAIVLAFTFQISNAQFGKIPVEATNAFQDKYPNARNVSWKNRLTTCKAEFDLDKKHYIAEFNSKGQWQKTETIIGYDKLPSEVSDGLHKSLYTTWEFTEIAQVDELDNEPVYRIKVKRSDLDKKYLFFSTTGQLVRESRTL